VWMWLWKTISIIRRKFGVIHWDKTSVRFVHVHVIHVFLCSEYWLRQGWVWRHATPQPFTPSANWGVTGVGLLHWRSFVQWRRASLVCQRTRTGKIHSSLRMFQFTVCVNLYSPFDFTSTCIQKISNVNVSCCYIVSGKYCS
jgi:hypothetical protein